MANPNKNKPVLDILSKNQDKLISFLSTFHNDRNGMFEATCKYVQFFVFCINEYDTNDALFFMAIFTPLEDEQFNDEKAFLLKQIQDL